MGKRNRRVTGTTNMRFSGPAAADFRLQGGVQGMFNNCSGGEIALWDNSDPSLSIFTVERNHVTPWRRRATSSDDPVSAIILIHGKVGPIVGREDLQLSKRGKTPCFDSLSPWTER